MTVRGQRSDGIRRRNELLDAALRCVADKGLLGTGGEDVRKAAQASASSVLSPSRRLSSR